MVMEWYSFISSFGWKLWHDRYIWRSLCIFLMFNNTLLFHQLVILLPCECHMKKVRIDVTKWYFCKHVWLIRFCMTEYIVFPYLYFEIFLLFSIVNVKVTRFNIFWTFYPFSLGLLYSDKSMLVWLVNLCPHHWWIEFWHLNR